MAPEYGSDVRQQIVQLRALDFTKGEIAEELDISRHTVSRHLKEVQQEAAEADDPKSVVRVNYKKANDFHLQNEDENNRGPTPDNETTIESRIKNLEKKMIQVSEILNLEDNST